MSEVDAVVDPSLVEEDAEDLYENAPCGYVSSLASGPIIKVNRTFLGLTGYERAGLVGERRFASLLTIGSRLFHELQVEPLIFMQGFVREIALDLVCEGDRLVPVLMNAVLRRDAAGAPVVVRMTIFDATDRRRYERELLVEKRRAEEALAQVKTLTGLLPICAWCRKVRGDEGSWTSLEAYIAAHFDASVSHGMCDGCYAKTDSE